LTADANFSARLGVSHQIFFEKQCTIRQYHSYLSDQSALEIRVSISVRQALF